MPVLSILLHHVWDRLPPGFRALVRRGQRVGEGTLGRSGLARKTARTARLPSHLGRPHHVGIEVTAACNARCIMCPRHGMDRAMRPMPFELFRKVIDDCADLGVSEVALNGYGEIFTIRREGYRQYIDYCRRRAPAMRVVINTNAAEMDEAAARYLVEAGVWAVHTNLDGATASTFERIRVHLHLEDCERNILRLVELRDAMGRKRPKVRVGIIEMPENRHEVAAFVAKWAGKVDVVAVDGYVNRMGTDGFTFVVDQGRPCSDLWTKLHVWADGQAVLCCEDWNASHVVGDVRTQGLAAIWRGPALADARRRHLEGTAAAIPMCAGCGYWRRGPWWWFEDREPPVPDSRPPADAAST